MLSPQPAPASACLQCCWVASGLSTCVGSVVGAVQCSVGMRVCWEQGSSLESMCWLEGGQCWSDVSTESCAGFLRILSSVRTKLLLPPGQQRCTGSMIYERGRHSQPTRKHAMLTAAVQSCSLSHGPHVSPQSIIPSYCKVAAPCCQSVGGQRLWFAAVSHFACVLVCCATAGDNAKCFYAPCTFASG